MNNERKMVFFTGIKGWDIINKETDKEFLRLLVKLSDKDKDQKTRLSQMIDSEIEDDVYLASALLHDDERD